MQRCVACQVIGAGGDSGRLSVALARIKGGVEPVADREWGVPWP